MIKQRDLTVKQTIEKIQLLNAEMEQLQKSLVLRVQLQEVTETQYNALVQIVKEGCAFLQNCQPGTIVTAEWIAKRNDLLERAQALMADGNKA